MIILNDLFNARKVPFFTNEMRLSRIIGQSCEHSWIFIVFFLIFASHGTPVAGFSSLFYNVSFIVLALGLIICGALYKRADTILSKKRTPIILGALMITSVVISFPKFGGNANIFLEYVGGVFAALGSGGLLLGYGKMHGAVTARVSAIEASISYLFASIMLLISQNLPIEVALILAVILPLPATFFLYRNQPIWSKVSVWEKESTGKIAFLPKVFFGILLLGIVIGIATKTFFYPTDEEIISRWFFSAALAASLLTLAIACLSKNLYFGFLYRPVILLLTAGLLSIPLLNGLHLSPYFIIMISYQCFDLMIWTLMADYSYRFQRPTTRIFGFGRGAFYLSSVIGSYLGINIFHFLPETGLAVPVYLVACSSILVLIVFGISTFLLNEKVLMDYSSTHWIQKDPLYKRCARLSSEFSLSAREEEVVRLVIKGRTVSRIQEELFMSKGTVNTHLHHIYRKMGIHSKQDLLDLFDKHKTSQPINAPMENDTKNQKRFIVNDKTSTGSR